MTQTDGLTGIANRRYFENQLDEEWESAIKSKQPISLLFIDIDHFKKYNDTFGHQQGDVCLQQIASRIEFTTINLDEKYVTARYGGEEFVVILPNTSEEKAVEVAEEIHNQIRSLKITRSIEDVSDVVTVSTGVATLVPTTNLEKGTIIKLADRALYEAKSTGRNRVVPASTLTAERV